MYQVGVALKIMQYVEHITVVYKKASGHLIFDIKMGFTYKERWVKNVHLTTDIEDSKYAQVVSCESVRIELTYATLHQTQVIDVDIRNDYLQSPTLEKHYIIYVIEFGLENVGKIDLIIRDLYGGKAAGHDFWHHLRSCMGFWGFKSKEGDPDIWMITATQKDGTLVYEYVLLYTDYCLVVSKNAESILKEEIGR